MGLREAKANSPMLTVIATRRGGGRAIVSLLTTTTIIRRKRSGVCKLEAQVGPPIRLKGGPPYHQPEEGESPHARK